MFDVLIGAIIALIAAVIAVFLILIAINAVLVLKLRSIIPPSVHARPPAALHPPAGKQERRR